MPDGSGRRDAPAFYVRTSSRGKKGEPFARIDSERLISMKFVDSEKKADVLSLVVDNFDLTQFDNGLWRKGQVIEFAFGYHGRMSPAREAVIKKVTGSLQLKIEAHAKSVLMDDEGRTDVFENMKRSDVVTKIAKRHGYSGRRLEVEDTAVVHAAINQAGMTDARFIRHLANREGFEFYVDHSGLHFHKRKLEQAPVRKLTYYLDEVGEVLSIQINDDITKKPGRVVRKGRDLKRKEDIEGVGDNESLKGEATLGDYVEVIDKITGETSGKSAVNVADDEVAPTAESSAEAAQRSAQARYRKSRSSAIKMTITMVGDPDMVAKTVFELVTPSRRLSGKYYASEVDHSLGITYSTQIKAIRDATSSNVGLDGDEGIPAEGKRNNEQTKDRDETTVIESVSPITGESRIQFVDKRGQQ